jgi:hypothetical protein
MAALNLPLRPLMNDDTHTEIHMFMAIGRATEGTRYPPGERHPILIMTRQLAGTGHDWDAAGEIAEKAGWTELDFTKAGTLPADAGEQTQEPFHSCHVAAQRDGGSLLVYDTVVSPAPVKKASAS